MSLSLEKRIIQGLNFVLIGLRPVGQQRTEEELVR